MDKREELIDFLWGSSKRKELTRSMTVQEMQDLIKHAPDTQDVSLVIELPQGEP